MRYFVSRSLQTHYPGCENGPLICPAFRTTATAAHWVAAATVTSCLVPTTYFVDSASFVLRLCGCTWFTVTADESVYIGCFLYLASCLLFIFVHSGRCFPLLIYIENTFFTVTAVFFVESAFFLRCLNAYCFLYLPCLPHI